MENALRKKSLDMREQYEKRFKELQEDNGKAIPKKGVRKEFEVYTTIYLSSAYRIFHIYQSGGGVAS